MTSHELKMACHENLNSETGRFRLKIFRVFFFFKQLLGYISCFLGGPQINQFLEL